LKAREKSARRSSATRAALRTPTEQQTTIDLSLGNVVIDPTSAIKPSASTRAEPPR
jgi:hypothetical protein